MTCDRRQLTFTLPCGTSRSSQTADGLAGTSTRLAEVRCRSLIRGFTGSAIVTPSTVNEYKWIVASIGPTVVLQTPSPSFVMECFEPTGIQSPKSVTSVALGARMRNVTWPSGRTSGETRPSGGGVCARLDAVMKSMAMSREQFVFIAIDVELKVK